jgi:hypothetical protein
MRSMPTPNAPRELKQWLDSLPSCKGASCNGGRLPCRENCNPLPEMACSSGGEPTVPVRNNRRPRRRNRAVRVLRDLVRWLLSPKAW